MLRFRESAKSKPIGFCRELHRTENRGNGGYEGKAYSTNILVGMMEETCSGAKSY